jgi:hypothetical protein
MNPIHRLESMNSLNLDRTFAPLCITTVGSVYPMTTNVKLFRHSLSARRSSAEAVWGAATLLRIHQRSPFPVDPIHRLGVDELNKL